MEKAFRKTGIDIIGDAPWGTHLCQFYETREDLVDILAPYFKAGLENNEFCMWITSEPLKVEDAKAALKKVVKNLDHFIKKGQIEILDYSEWYTKSRKFGADEALQGWVNKENEAVKRGYDGLRLAGNTFWLEERDWRDFADYEVAVNNVIGKYRMLAVCSYSLDKCGASEVIDVVSNHQFALIRREGKWVIIESSDRKRAEETLRESEEKYYTLFEESRDAIVITTREGKFIDINKAGLELFGYTKEELMILNIRETYANPDDRLRFQQKIEREGFVRDRELKYRKKDGTEMDCLITSTLRQAIDGSILGYQGIIRDITERKRAEEALRESKGKYQALVETINDVIYAVDPSGVITYISPAVKRITKYELEELIGRNFFVFVHEADREKLRNRLRELFEGVARPFEYRLVDKDGSTIWVRSFSAIVRSESGTIVSITGVLSDITERKQAEEELIEREAFNFALFEYNPIQTVVVDLEGKVTGFNLAKKRSGDRLPNIGDAMYKDYAGGHETDMYGELMNCIRSGEEKEFPEEKYGDKVLSITISPFPKGAVIISQDITERKRAEEVVRRSEEEAKRLAQENAIVAEIGRITSSTLNIEEIYERFAGEMHKLIDFERVAMNIIDPEERTFIIPYVSGLQVADRRTGDVIPLAGTGTEEIMRTRSSLFILDKDWESVISRCPGLSPIFKAGFQSVMMVPLISKNDVIGVLNIQSMRRNAYTETDLRIAERIGIQISGAIASAQLFSERMRAEEERERLLADLEAKNKEMEAYVYTVSHDLKAPLVSLNGFSGALQKEYESQLGEEGKHYLERIQANVAHMDDLITSLLELSRIGQVIGSIEEIDVAALLREIQNALAVRLKEAGAEFVVQEPLPTVHADRGRIHQVFANLIDNAVKFRSAERALRIEVGCRQESGFYRFHVADNGIGIVPEYHEQIFAPFRKLHPEIEGVGIGLALVKKIVEHHGGRVWVYSEAGKGSTFYFTIPRG
jgi:PAS domain S-box-containing protein